MRENGIEGRQKRRFPSHNRLPPRICRSRPTCSTDEFEPSAPNEAWVTDVTYISTDEGWLYLAVMLDLFSRRVVGWAVQREERHCPRPRGARPRAQNPPSRSRAAAPLRPRQPVRQRRLPARSARTRDRRQHEPHRRLLRQRRRRELLRYAQGRARRPRALRLARRCRLFDRRLHRDNSTTPRGVTRLSATSARSSSN